MKNMPNNHPEVQIKIPFRIITAITPEAKRKEAEGLRYDGPLTLLEAVQNGSTPAENAVGLIEHWWRGGGVPDDFAAAWVAEIRSVRREPGE